MPSALDQAVDLAGGDAVDVGLHHDTDDRLLAGTARLQEGGEVGLATALARHRQLDLPDPGLPQPLPVAVAVCCSLHASLSPPGADLAGDLGLHQLRGDHRHRLAQEVGVLGDQGLGDDLGGRHALALGHRGVLSSLTWWSTDESGARGGRNFVPAPTCQLHHFYRRDLRRSASRLSRSKPASPRAAAPPRRSQASSKAQHRRRGYRDGRLRRRWRYWGSKVVITRQSSISRLQQYSEQPPSSAPSSR